jgi:hypothetical protein
LETKPSTHELLGDIKDPNHAWRWWLTSIILAIQEAEIRRIAVQTQPEANSS